MLRGGEIEQKTAQGHTEDVDGDHGQAIGG